MKKYKSNKYPEAITAIVTAIIGTIIKGFVISKLWLWFIVSTFHLQPLRTIEAIGIIILLSLLRSKTPKGPIDDEIDYEKFKNFLVNELFIPWVYLFLGWVASLFL